VQPLEIVKDKQAFLLDPCGQSVLNHAVIVRHLIWFTQAVESISIASHPSMALCLERWTGGFVAHYNRQAYMKSFRD
jgi:hypothetical protein